MSGVRINGEWRCTRQTDAAIFVDNGRPFSDRWIPQSVIDEDSEVYKKGTSGKLIVAEW